MFENDNEIAAAIEDGTYFRESRRWYSSVYMSLISERYFFIVLTSIAFLTSVIALIAVLRLLPLNPRMPFLYEARNAYEEVPTIVPIKTYRTQDMNDALRRFFLVEYVSRREGYSSRTVDDRLNFVRNYSDEETYERYDKYLDIANPRSPVQKLGNLYTLSAAVDSSTLVITPSSKPDTYLASVEYEVDLYTQKLEKQVSYRADLTFSYKDLIVDQTDDMHKGDHFKITPMEFKVTDYKVKQIR